MSSNEAVGRFTLARRGVGVPNLYVVAHKEHKDSKDYRDYREEEKMRNTEGERNNREELLFVLSFDYGVWYLIVQPFFHQSSSVFIQ